MKKAWYIEGYTMGGNTYCRNCVAETLNDDSFCDPYTTDEHAWWTPIFASDVDTSELEEMYCEYCFEPLDNTPSV
jgi:hypothetical protein